MTSDAYLTSLFGTDAAGTPGDINVPLPNQSGKSFHLNVPHQQFTYLIPDQALLRYAVNHSSLIKLREEGEKYYIHVEKEVDKLSL